MPPSRKTRRDPAHGPPAGETVMRLLLRLWAGDTLTVIGGELHLTRVGDATDVFPVPVEMLNELEWERAWVKVTDDGEQVRLTFAGKTSLSQWARRRHPDKRAMLNAAGERLELRR